MPTTETALARRRRLGRELYRIRQEQIAQGAKVNLRTGKRWKKGTQETMPTGATVVGKEQGTGGGAWARLAAGMYDADVADIEDVEPSAQHPDWGRQFRFNFEIHDAKSIEATWEIDGETFSAEEGEELTNADGSAITIMKSVSQKYSTGKRPSNLWVIAQALGCEPAPGAALDVDSMIRKPCRLLISRQDSDKGERPFIADVMPARKAAGKPSAAAPGVKAAAKAAPADAFCVVPECGKEADYATAKGTFFCQGHGPGDL